MRPPPRYPAVNLVLTAVPVVWIGKNGRGAFLGPRGPDRAPSDSARVLIAEVTELPGSFRSSSGIDKTIRIFDRAS
jgi:hypothetical protein